MTPSNPSPEHNHISALLRAYDRFLLGCDTVIGSVVTIAMAVLSSVLVLQVFYRYAMNDFLDLPLSWLSCCRSRWRSGSTRMSEWISI
jgi:hypothetical protein